MRAPAAATALSKLTRKRLKLRNHWNFTFGENILNKFSISSRCDSLVKTSECMLVTVCARGNWLKIKMVIISQEINSLLKYKAIMLNAHQLMR